MDFSIEAGAKFLILSALSTALLLFGLVFLYGYTGATRIDEIVARMAALPFESGVPFGSLAVMLSVLLIVAGFGFKMAIAPWHMWVPDVYQGAPTPVAAFLSVASKASAFAVLMRLLYSFAGFDPVAQDWQILFALIATASMTVGNLMALSQTNVKRLLAYSTIAQAGYIMVGFAAVSVASSSGSTSAGSTEHHVLLSRIRIYQPRSLPRLRCHCPPHRQRHYCRFERIAETVAHSRHTDGHRTAVAVGNATYGRIHG